jgi:hypothetical protein
MKIKLPLDNIREFFVLSQYLQSDEILINKYIKFEIVFGSCILHKKNFSGFCKYSFNVNGEDCSFLVPEIELKSFCNKSESKEITISIEGNNIILQDGYFKSTCSNGGFSQNEFPSLPEEPSKNQTTFITNDILETLKIAKSFASKDNLSEQWSSIYIDEDIIYSSAQSYIYLKNLNKTLPKISIAQKELSLISSLNEVYYFNNSNYNLYIYKNIVYGYLLSVNAVGHPSKQVMSKLKRDNYIKVNKKDILNFCDSTKGFVNNPRDFINAKFTINDSTNLNLFYKNGEENKENELNCKIDKLVGNPFEFVFQYNIWLDLLKALPYNDICIGNEPHMNCLSVWNENDKNCVCIFPKMWQ